MLNLKHTLIWLAKEANTWKRGLFVRDMKTAGAIGKEAITFSRYSGLSLAITKNAVLPWLCDIIKIFFCSVCAVMWSIIAGISYIPISFQLYIQTNYYQSKITWSSGISFNVYLLHTWISKNLGLKWSSSSACASTCCRAHCPTTRRNPNPPIWSLNFGRKCLKMFVHYTWI